MGTTSDTEYWSDQQQQAMSKVPEVTIFFWIIKVLATTVGETAADFLATNLHLGLIGTTAVMAVALAIALYFQFRSDRYVPGVYWVSIVLISVVGTLVTDNLTDKFHVSLILTTCIFAVALITTFVAWYRSEGTLSIHSIRSAKREGFYWLAILFTFALGTASGDLIAEKMSLGYWKSAILFAACIAIVAVAAFALRLNAVLAFWLAYILTRPLGASIGDYLSQPASDGGRGLGTTGTSVIFLTLILVVVAYLTVSRRDQPQPEIEPA